MKIECPICSMQIEISKEHIGRKGRCDRCESKFIIPANPDDEFEILHRGEKPKEKPKRDRSLVVPAKGHKTVRRMPIRSNLTKSDSPLGMFAMIATFVAVVVGVVLLLKGLEDEPNQPKRTAASSTNKPLSSTKDAWTQSDDAFGGSESPTTKKSNPKQAVAPVIAVATEPVEPVVSNKDPESVEVPVEDISPALTEGQKNSALTFLKSNQASKRKSAYAGYRKLGNREKASYLEALEEARAHHSGELGGRAFQLSIDKNPLSAFGDDYSEWIGAKDAARKMVQTNWKDKDPGNYKKKHAEMDQAFAKVSKLYTKAMRSVKRAESFEPSGLQGFADILAEIRIEIAWCHGEDPPEPLSLHDEISQADGADRYLEILDAVVAANEFVAAQESAEKHNSDSDWANGAYQSFATTLNDRRVALGLTPLRLDERLSKGCRDHSADMAANGYFSHTGLTPETKSFGKRAKRAGFSGFATGECIFMGSASPDSAHNAWWYSDGHRLIMYAGNPNTLGLGLHGKHWTLNTGKL